MQNERKKYIGDITRPRENMTFIFEYFPKNTRVYTINANAFMISELTVEGKDLLFSEIRSWCNQNKSKLV